MTVYQHKRSATAAAVPTAGQLLFGEIAVNTADGNAFTRLQDGSVVNITTPLPSRIQQGGASTGQVLQWNGSIWNPAFQGMPIESLEQSGATNNQVIQWDDTEGMWMAYTLQPGTLGQASATTGQVLRWNGTSWAPYTIPAVAPADITAGGAFTGQYLKWSGTAWTPTYFVPAPWELDTNYATEGQFIGFDGESYFPLTVLPSNLGQQSATTGQCIAWGGSSWAPAARLTRTVNVQTFEASGTWTKPAGAVSVAIKMSGGGSGGNYGGTTASSPNAIGGAAGEGISVVIAADYLGATETVTIGAGGTGGVGAGVGGTPAAVSGTQGNPSSFGTTEIKAFAFGGAGGISQYAGNYGMKQLLPSFSPSVWGSGGATSSPNQSGAFGFHYSGGGGCGAVALGAAGFAGGSTNSFGVVEAVFGRSPGRGGGGAGGATGATGANGTAGSINGNGFASGGGGGGAPPNGATTAMGGNGGAGIRGSGGGGGGRGGSTSAGSNGGAGGNGFAIITTVCYT